MPQIDIVTFILSCIEPYRKSNIDLAELQSAFAGQAVDYPAFAEALLQLEQDGLLIPVKLHGRNGRTPSLAYRYRIDRQKLRRDQVSIIQTAAQQLHPAIKLDAYYGRTSEEWKNDVPHIQQIHQYLTQYGLPQDEITAPERSFALTGDEKWIDEQGGRELLEKIGLWTSMRIFPASDPLMLAIHPRLFNGVPTFGSSASHLIVENKATFHALLGRLNDLPFATVIYGSGNKIVGNLQMFAKQVPLPHVHHTFYYFGDLDWEGIRIWHSLNRRYDHIRLAAPFYIAALQHDAVSGKTNQRQDHTALSDFSQHLPDELARRLNELLNDGRYIPQEVLSAEELHRIGRMSVWTEA
ncbi:Wadjet anti-phage system protein JetD domain-containing protein [Saccharibacillus brassicae]|nr:Wadjet anti-phage system protein JetD domain-containing protein [Saccharibacillus brassicae]